MTSAEFKRAFQIASAESDLSAEDESAFSGCALPGFRPAVATIRQTAFHIRMQCRNFRGGWDAEALQETQSILRRTITILD